MIFAVDALYTNDTAHAAGILFSDWYTDIMHEIIRKEIHHIAAYEPGSFYKRELPVSWPYSLRLKRH